MTIGAISGVRARFRYAPVGLSVQDVDEPLPFIRSQRALPPGDACGMFRRAATRRAGRVGRPFVLHPRTPHMQKQYRNVLVLSGCQATLQITGATMIAVTGLGIAGSALLAAAERQR